MRAEELLEAHPEIALLLTDVVMPETNGRLLAEEAQRRRPALRVVFMTGYTQNAIIHNGVVDPGTNLVTKPFTISELGAELDAVLAEDEKTPASSDLAATLHSTLERPVSI